MKRLKPIIFFALVVFAIAGLVWAGTAQRFPYGARLGEISDPGVSPPSGYGEMRVEDNSGTMTLYFEDDDGNKTNLLSTTSNTLDQSYDQGGAGSGRSITADSGAVVITNTDADTTNILELNKSPSGAAAGDALDITVGANGTGAGIDINNSGSGSDIDGTSSTWYVTKAGAATFTSLTAGAQYLSAIAAAASGNTNLTIDAAGTGTITVGGTSTGAVTVARNTTFSGNAVVQGNTDIGNAATDTLTITSIIDGNVTLDDGVTASPSLIFKDATDETATFSKADTDVLSLTTDATDGLNVLTGNLWVGNGSPGTAAMDGEDFYCEGASEFDGSMQVDGAMTVAGAASFTSTVALSENVTFTMAADEYLKLDAATTPMTQTAGALDINVIAGATSVSAIDLDLEAEDTFAQMYGIKIDVDDDASGGEETVDGIYISNSAGTASAVRGLVLANTLDDGVVAAVGAAGQAIVIDADATAHTETAGVVDIALGTVTTGTSGINVDVNVGDTQGGGEVISGILVDLDDDTSSQTSTIRGFSATSSDLTGEASTVVQGFYTSGCDAAFQADNGYVRIGTGSTPDVTPSDDDLFVEGTVEIDGNLYPDGDVIGDGATHVYGVISTIDNDADGKAQDVFTVADSGKVYTNASAVGGGIWNLPAAVGGEEFTFVVMAAQNMDINPDDADQILGLTNGVNNAIRNATVGSTVTLKAVDATNWVVKSYYGTWTDVD